MMNEGGRGPGPIPERWLHCPRRANDLLANQFLAFKTPLGEKFNEQIPPKFRFTPSMLFESTKDKHQKLGLWIDLTKTNRFYDSEEVKSYGCKYVKIGCQGHEGAPTVEQTEFFIKLCEMFRAKDPINVIGVHCTHGFNRTGFLIVSYLVEVFGSSVEGAIQQFARVRAPGIYKEDYIKELYRRYGDVTDVPRPPPLPSWCLEEVTESDYNSKNNRKKREPRFKDNPVFMDGVPGVEPVLDREEITRIRDSIRILTGAKDNSFIGSQPVSMDRKNIKLLAEKPYKVSWKADGTRYMMYIANKDEIYFIDRDNSPFKVNGLQFFFRKCNTQHLTNTLLDGEMVIDKDGMRLYPRYLVYDIICFAGEMVTHEPFDKIRMRMIEIEIIEPRIEAMKERRIFKEREPFSIRAKQFYELQKTSHLLGEKFAKQLTHPPDGLIFQPCKDPYTFGTADTVLKWKPGSLNSIDFRLEVRHEKNLGCLPEYIGYLKTGSGRVFARIKCNKQLRELDNKIIECTLENNQWVFMRERTDKSFPNADSTAQAVLESIRSPVTQEMLLDFINKYAWKDPMPPPMTSPPVKKPRTM